jgi:hypothetical protein
MIVLCGDLIFFLSKHQIWRAAVRPLHSALKLADALRSLDEAMQSLSGGVQRIDPESWRTLTELIDSKRLLLVRAAVGAERRAEEV